MERMPLKETTSVNESMLIARISRTMERGRKSGEEERFLITAGFRRAYES